MKPNWTFERSSGYDGWRCRTCGTWIYDGESWVCDCLGTPEQTPLEIAFSNFEELSKGLIDPVDLEVIKYIISQQKSS